MTVPFVLLPRIWPAIAPIDRAADDLLHVLALRLVAHASTARRRPCALERIGRAAEGHRVHRELHDDLVIRVLAALELRHLEVDRRAGGNRRAVGAASPRSASVAVKVADRVGVRADALVGAKR